MNSFRTATMATTNKLFCRLSFGFGISCLVFLIVAFASDHWVVSTETQVAGFKNLGLWSACFARFRPPAWVMMNKYYDGCWWVFDREMDDLRFFLIPPWFVATQVLVTVSLVFQLFAIIIMIINAINCFPHSRFKDEILLGLSTAATILHGLTAILLTIAVIMFGARADNERTWLEKPDQNYLSWSFGMCVLAAFLAILAFLTTMLESYRMWLKRKNRDEPDEIFTIPPPAKGMMSYPPSNSRIIYPVHTGRFSNQESQSAGNKKFSDIISGKDMGEFNANSSHDVDEIRQRGRTNGYVPQQERRQETRQFDNESYKDNVDSTFTQSENKAPSSQTYSVSTKTSAESTDYEESKKIKQPVLPEYIPKAKSDISKKDLDSSFDDESYDSEDKLNDDDQCSRPRKTKSNSKGKKTAKNLTNSKKDKNKKHSETKTRKSKNDNSDDERSRSRSRSKKSTSSSKRKKSHSKERSSSRHQSQSRDRSSSRHRSHSRDLNSVYTDSCSESDSVSVVSSSRRRQKIEKGSSEKGRRRHKSSEDFIKKDKDGRSKAGSSGSKKRKGSYSDDISEYSSKQQSKKKDDKSNSLKEKRTKSLDFSDSESLNSKHSKRVGRKSKSSYSSYYEY